MTVNSFNIEFGYELLSAVPYAYELYLRGELTETVSGAGSEPLYYFSPDHKINPSQRSWFNTKDARRARLPYTHIHQPEQPDKKFPPYKEHYKNEEFKWDKPTLCICNRYNVEWGHEPINFFSEDILEWMFSQLKDKYEIIYFPVDLPEHLQDNAHSMELDDIAVARRHGVQLFSELQHKLGWNETLLRVFANCEHFITMNGGYSIMASLFSGTNIIYSKPGKPETKEIKQGSFWRWYPNHNDQRSLHVESYQQLQDKIRALYIDELPCYNVLVRTSFRPNYLAKCMKSIEQQTYPNINVVLICDSDHAIEYTRKYRARMIRLQKRDKPGRHPDPVNYGKPFPYNEYLAEVQGRVQGFIQVLDDDDIFTHPEAVANIVRQADPGALMIWKTDFKAMGIKPSSSFRKEPTLMDIGGISFCYHSDHVEHTDWTPWKRADFRTAKKLSETLPTVWIDEVLTSIQDRLGAGIKADLQTYPEDKFLWAMMEYPGGRKKKQSFKKDTFREFADIYERQGIKVKPIEDHVPNS